MKDKKTSHNDTTVIHLEDGMNAILNSTENQAQERPASLLAIGGPSNGALFELNDSVVTVGRNSNSGICIVLDGVSRSHFRLYCKNEEWFVEDTQSKNGTYLNNVRLDKPEKLTKGDIIKVLDIAFKFLPKGDSERLAYDELQLAANTDGHTGCFNKNHFNRRLSELFNASLKLGNHLGLIIFDLDHFKQLNDRFGHDAGDFVLKEVAKQIQKRVIRVDDIFARYGGEEFTVLLPNTDLEGACLVAERIRGIIEHHDFVYDGKTLRITASIGVSALNETMQEHSELFKSADKATYNAKRLGRNRVATF